MNVKDWHSALFKPPVLIKLSWILIRVVVAFICAQQGTHFIYQGF